MKVSVAVRSGLAALLAAGVAASAQGPGPGPGFGPGFGQHRPPMERALGPGGDHGRWWNDPQMVQKLKLTDDQRKAMDAILLEHREKLIDMRANVEKAELGMEPLMHDDQPNEGKILAQIDKVAQARAELEKANARFLLALRGKLTPDQWKQLQASREERMEHREMRHQDGPGHMGRGGMGPDHQPGPAGEPHSAPQ
jgi:periplasmic protein CpxP/Spy